MMSPVRGEKRQQILWSGVRKLRRQTVALLFDLYLFVVVRGLRLLIDSSERDLIEKRRCRYMICHLAVYLFVVPVVMS